MFHSTKFFTSVIPCIVIRDSYSQIKLLQWGYFSCQYLSFMSALHAKVFKYHRRS